jgi:hypothetical protein
MSAAARRAATRFPNFFRSVTRTLENLAYRILIGHALIVTLHPTFQELCILASRERWCWKIPCTTCGNADFRFALRELAEGELSEQWWSLAAHREGLQERLRPLAPLRPWPLAVQRALVSKIVNADLADIARRGRFPDWLGFVGLALFKTEEAERNGRVLTKTWSRQLAEMLPAAARADSPLAAILENPRTVLTWRNLEAVEQGLSSMTGS